MRSLLIRLPCPGYYSVYRDRTRSHVMPTPGICKFVPHTNATWKMTPLSLGIEHNVCSDPVPKPTVEIAIFWSNTAKRLKDTLYSKTVKENRYYYFLH